MTFREELDVIYEKIWGGEMDYFQWLLERFIPFSRWGFSFIEKKNKGLSTKFVYRSQHLRVEISPDLEPIEGAGIIRFFYSRLTAPDEIDKKIGVGLGLTRARVNSTVFWNRYHRRRQSPALKCL